MRRRTSKHLSKSEVDAGGAGQRMLSILERSDTVIDEARRPAPHHDVAMFDLKAPHWIGPPFAAPQEQGRQTQGNRNNRRPCVVLIAILVQTELGARDVTITATIMKKGRPGVILSVLAEPALREQIATIIEKSRVRFKGDGFT